MKKSKLIQLVGVVALLGSSIASAATLNVVASNNNPLVGEVFTVTLQGTGFVNQVGGITLSLASNAAVVTLQSAVLPAAGPLSPANGTFLVNNNPTFDWLPGSQIPTGSFDVGTFTFLAIGNGAAGIGFSDDGGIFTGWFDNNTADPIAVSYNNPNVIVGAPVPVPAAAWLLISALGSMVVLKRRAA